MDDTVLVRGAGGRPRRRSGSRREILPANPLYWDVQKVNFCLIPHFVTSEVCSGSPVLNLGGFIKW